MSSPPNLPIHDEEALNQQPLLPLTGSSPPAIPSKLTFRIRRPYVPLQKRRLLVGIACGAVISILVLLTQDRSHKSPVTPSPPLQSSFNEDVRLPNTTEPKVYSPFLRGPPTDSFRENLRPEYRYITSWLSAGWNNDVITYMNLIYLGMITERIPILATFMPLHIGRDAEPILFSDVFDIPRFGVEADHPLLEWHEVKNVDSETWEDLGCWDIWEASQMGAGGPRSSIQPLNLKLDLSYTRAPDWVKLIPGYEHDQGSSFWALARLAFPEEREQSKGTTYASELHGAVLEPDEHLLCYDYLYYVSAAKTGELDFEYSPSWRYVGKYLHFTQQIEDLARDYVNEVFGLPRTNHLPAYISIHVRHGDFKDWCWEAELPEDCFAPLSVIARRVREVQEELFDRRGINVPTSRVIMTSDESDPVWWEEVAAQGWVRMDHEKLHTVERFGRWHPVILDAAIQAAGLGFVGTDRSTFSTLSRRRVLGWNDGAARIFKWGRKGADDH